MPDHGTHGQQLLPKDIHLTRETADKCTGHITSDKQNLSISGSDRSHRQQPRPMDSCLNQTWPGHPTGQSNDMTPSISDCCDNHSQTTAGTIKYSAEHLRKLKPEVCKITRKTRKTLFKCGIWKPKNNTTDSLSDSSKGRPSNLKTNPKDAVWSTNCRMCKCQISEK